MDGAGAQLALVLAAGRELDAPVDEIRELVGVHEHAVEAQDVRDQVVGEDRQAVDVRTP